MLELHHFHNGWVIPVLAYVMSVIGSVLGLRCAAHARNARQPGGWLMAAAIALGGCGIWVMHFTAMLGFAIDDATIRYDMPMTVLSAAIAIVVVWVGLTIAVRVPREIVALPVGGAITGIGVAAMHYLGMYAMHSSARVEYDTELVTLSIGIAVIAATAALWFMLHVRGFRSTIGAAIIMGVAVCGMHYTGMAALHAHSVDHHKPVGGVDSLQLVSPLFIIVTAVTMLLIILVGLAEVDDRSEIESPSRPTNSDSAEDDYNWPRSTASTPTRLISKIRRPTSEHRVPDAPRTVEWLLRGQGRQ